MLPKGALRKSVHNSGSMIDSFDRTKSNRLKLHYSPTIDSKTCNNSHYEANDQSRQYYLVEIQSSYFNK